MIRVIQRLTGCLNLSLVMDEQVQNHLLGKKEQGHLMSRKEQDHLMSKNLWPFEIAWVMVEEHDDLLYLV